MSLPPVGLQCIVFGKTHSIEDESVLDHVAACGYAGVEAGAKDPIRFRQMLDARGMKRGGSHTGPAALVDPEPIIEDMAIFDCHDLCNSGLMQWDKRTPADYAETIEILNRAGKRLGEAGIKLHYHNHAFEFEPVDGDRTGMDLFIEGLDPEAVDLCVDVGWVAKAGRDPAAFLREHKDRVGYLHFKDFNDDGWIELGQGHVDFAGVMNVLPELTNVSWVMIEQDSTNIDPLESVKLSRKFLHDTYGY